MLVLVSYCSLSLFTLNESGPLSCCGGIEIVTPATTVDYCALSDATSVLTTVMLVLVLLHDAIGTKCHCSSLLFTLNESGPLSCCGGIEIVTPISSTIVAQGPTHATNYRNTPAVNYSICNRYKHCSFCPVTLNDSGPLSSCDGIEVVTQAIIDYCSTRTHTCY